MENKDINQEEVSVEKADEAVTENSTKRGLLSVLEYVEIFVVALIAVLFIFSFAFKICAVDGESMLGTLKHQEKLITHNVFYSPKCGDIVVFYENEPLNKPLVKRVIATEGQTVQINHANGVVKVDGQILDEPYAYYEGGSYIHFSAYMTDEGSETYTVTVPKGQVFVMGDNRNNSMDSRFAEIGCISENQIMGKAILRISPFTTFS